MEFIKKYKLQLFFAVLFIVIGLFVYKLCVLYLPLELNNIVNIVSVISAYTSIYALIIMLVQVISFKEVAKETRERINTALSISDYSKLVELTKYAQEDIKKNNYELALYRLQLLREFILNNKYRVNGVNEDFSSYLSLLGSHISTLHECTMEKSSNQINKIVIINDLEDLIEFILDKSGEAINQDLYGR